ncbi:MAG: signal recognition particle protein [Alphaproteobacteria bacterium]|nr:signal recognition particle protein [Alphaproteobacteria bacterium]
MFDTFSDRLKTLFSSLSNRGVLTESLLDETLQELKKTLLEADVALPVVKKFLALAKEKALGQQIFKSIKPSDQFIKIVNDVLIEFFESENSALNLKGKEPVSILFLGLQGTGKTTSCAKIAYKLQKEGHHPLLISLDIHRPAAQDQLQALADDNGLLMLPVLAKEAIQTTIHRAFDFAAKKGNDILLFDTAGRGHLDSEMMEELIQIHQNVSPLESLLTVDSMMGQDAVRVAEAFQGQLPLTGIILTRVDGDARGGAALSMREVTGKPIKFLGVGEKIENLETFDAKRVASRILGMGDIVGLVETTMEKIKQDEAEKIAERMMSGAFNLDDMLAQLKQIKNLGDIKGFMMMIPGLSQFKKQIENSPVGNKLIARQEAILLSMTPKERKNPDLIKASRKKRIALGSGVSVNDVNKLLKQYEQMATMMKKLKKLGPLGMLGGMKSLMPKGFPQNGGGFPPFNF